jgi:hypothetical protein
MAGEHLRPGDQTFCFFFGFPLLQRENGDNSHQLRSINPSDPAMKSVEPEIALLE